MKWNAPATALIALTLLVPPPVLGGVTLDSEPRPLHLRIQGPVRLEGSTPLELDVLPRGAYLLRASGPGMPTARGRLRNTAQGLSLERWATAYAFLAPPGFVHAVREDRWRGAMFLGAAAVGVTAAILNEAQRKSAESEIAQLQSVYDMATTENEATNARIALETAWAREDDESTMRNLWAGYAAAVWIGAAVESWLLTLPARLQANGGGEYLMSVRTARPLAAALRSALVPGSGQRYMGFDRRGVLFGISFLSLAGSTLWAYDGYLEARRDEEGAQKLYDTAATEDELVARAAALERAADDANDWNVVAWSLAGVTGAMYLWNVLDAMGLGAASENPSAWAVGLLPSATGLTARVTWGLP